VSGRFIFPPVPEAGKCKEIPVREFDGPGLLGLVVERLPFLESCRRNETPPTLQLLPEDRAGADSLGACVDRRVGNFGVFRKERNQTPPHDRQLTLTRFVVRPDHRLQALRSVVVGRRKVRVIKDVRTVSLHSLRDALPVCPSAVSPAQRSTV